MSATRKTKQSGDRTQPKWFTEPRFGLWAALLLHCGQPQQPRYAQQPHPTPQYSGSDSSTQENQLVALNVNQTAEAGDASVTITQHTIESYVDTSPSAPPQEPVTAQDTTETAPAPETFRGLNVEELTHAMATRPVVRLIGRYHSTTSVYRLDLGGGLQVAFKPEAEGQQGWWRHDIAAWHLARLLGISSNVPPVVGRSIPVGWLRGFIERDHLLPSRRNPNVIVGSAIFWMPVLRLTPLGHRHSRVRWMHWLQQSHTPPAPGTADYNTAEQISSLLLFDYLQANEDRWNPANLQVDEQSRIVFRDNNAGWFVSAMRDWRWGVDHLRVAERLSPRTVRAIEQDATPERLRQSLASDPMAPVLSAGHLRAYEQRRQWVLNQIQRVRQRYGDEHVFYFP